MPIDLLSSELHCAQPEAWTALVLFTGVSPGPTKCLLNIRMSDANFSLFTLYCSINLSSSLLSPLQILPPMYTRHFCSTDLKKNHH